MNFIQSSKFLSISLYLKEVFHRHPNKLSSSLFLKNHLYPLMISTTFIQFQTSTSFPKFLIMLLPPSFSLPTLCLLHFNLLIRSFILLKLLFSNDFILAMECGEITSLISRLICCFRYCRSFHPHSSSKLVQPRGAIA